jgi:hypothetical protein
VKNEPKEKHMDIREAVVEEISRLNKVLALLDGRSVSSGATASGRKTRKTGTGKRRKMSAAARKKISDAQKARWAKARKAA